MTLIIPEKENDKALKRLELLFDSKSKNGQEAELLALLIEEYEETKYPIDTRDPIAAIRIRMEALELKQEDLVGAIGSKRIVSEVLNKKRTLTVNIIRNLSDKFKIAAKVLIQEYDLQK